MGVRKLWSVYEVGSTQPLHELEAQFERTALDHAAAIHNVKIDRLYAIPRALTSKGKRPRYVTLAWSLTEDQEPDPRRRSGEANYAESEIPKLLAWLRSRGATTAWVNDREVTL